MVEGIFPAGGDRFEKQVERIPGNLLRPHEPARGSSWVSSRLTLSTFSTKLAPNGFLGSFRSVWDLAL
jgi:hypothetical protein